MSLVTLPTVVAAQEGTQSVIHISLWVHGTGHENVPANGDSILGDFSRVNQEPHYIAAI